MSDLVDETARLNERLVGWRRDFHRHPEPGFCEFRTASAVIRELADLGYDLSYGPAAMNLGDALDVPHERVADWHERALRSAPDELLEAMADGSTAVVAELRGNASGPTVAFRFDMDALPIGEAKTETHLPVARGFASESDGYMHACGHDGHTAIGLGLASVLAGHRDDLTGTVRLIFQPAEEGAPGGAASIVARGFFDDVDYLVCSHLGLEARSLGHVVCRTSFLATTKYRITYSGRAAHVVNAPQEGRNALLAAASAALAIHGIAPSSDGWFSANVGVLRAGTEQGVVPAEAVFELGLWSTSPEAQEYARSRILEILSGIAGAWDVEVRIDHIGEAPAAHQDEKLGALVARSAETLPEINRIDHFLECRAAEDATVLLSRVHHRGGKGVYLLIGAGLTGGHHTPEFDFDERALQTGTALLSTIALELMR